MDPYEQVIEVEEALLPALVELMVSGKLAAAFPDGPVASPVLLGKRKLPTVLLEVATYLHEAQEKHSRTLPDAVRIALVAYDCNATRLNDEQRKQLKELEAKSWRNKYATEAIINRIMSQL